MELYVNINPMKKCDILCNLNQDKQLKLEQMLLIQA